MLPPYFQPYDKKLHNSSSAKKSKDAGGISMRNALAILVIIFVFSILSLTCVYSCFPELPRDIEDAKHLGAVLSRFKDKYYLEVLGGVFITYIFLQTFAIPGSIFLSILSGYLFPFYLALILVCFCSATGASLCYLLSYLVGTKLVNKFAKERAESWAQKVNQHRNNLLNYIIFLRITPFLPNWFINITSPVIGVPLGPFFFGTFLGVAPPSFVAIQAGTTLNQLTSSSDTVSLNSILILAAFAVLSLLPVVFKRQLQKKFS
ncbi:hypothetical protein GHT06_010814 [Daphnia sinensis]|uniref:VTT domain-containing protein n=1 Tax=Daphnia sinensis TaxID=1820382 RepID=A0AAD5PZG0_9CRUS|nr:hypothetical protein GHT06_010814 [Daphnia sinensis]